MRKIKEHGGAGGIPRCRIEIWFSIQNSLPECCPESYGHGNRMGSNR
ncbi:MAG: hypothetical protein J5819_08015 [Eubacterium sp.]|nr:hypothetical protein [Eubacterium sp.]